jgi:hypothetical protein
MHFYRQPLSQNSHVIDYVLPDYNDIKQGYIQSTSMNNDGSDNTRKNLIKQQQQQQQQQQVIVVVAKRNFQTIFFS